MTLEGSRNRKRDFEKSPVSRSISKCLRRSQDHKSSANCERQEFDSRNQRTLNTTYAHAGCKKKTIK